MTTGERARARAGVAALTAALAVTLLWGCAVFESLEPRAAPWVPVRGERRDPAPVQPLARVLVLPLLHADVVPEHTVALRTALAETLRESCGYDVIAPALEELPRTTRDELVRGSVSAKEASALVRLHREWEADAVLFGRVPFSRLYGEPAVGLELELIDARDGSSLWHAQDVIDARDPGVRASLLSFHADESGGADDTEDATQVPFDVFARFVARSYVRTLFEPIAPPDGAPPGMRSATPKTAPERSEVPGKRFAAGGER